jgi:hypothetical protein
VPDGDLCLDVPGLEVVDQHGNDPLPEAGHEADGLVHDRHEVRAIEGIDVEDHRHDFEERFRLAWADLRQLVLCELEAFAQLIGARTCQEGPDPGVGILCPGHLRTSSTLLHADSNRFGVLDPRVERLNVLGEDLAPAPELFVKAA